MRQLLLDQALANAHTNAAWLDVMAEVPFAELDAPRGAFFGSIFGTWNHILLGDRIWLGRLADRPFSFTSLHDRLCPDLPTLRAERARTDRDLIAFVEAADDPARPVDYRDSRGNPYRQPLYELLLHLFAHQNHHRGQISQMCHEMKLPIPDGGMLLYYRSRTREEGD